MTIGTAAMKRLRESAESLNGEDSSISVLFIGEENGGPSTVIRYSFEVPAGRYVTDPVQPAVVDPSFHALETTLAVWREMGIEPLVTGTAISNNIDKGVRRTWRVQPGVV